MLHHAGDAEPGSSGAAVGTAATGRRSSLAAAKQLDAALNAAGAEPEPEPEQQQPEPEPEPEPEQRQPEAATDAEADRAVAEVMAGGLQSSPATPPTEAPPRPASEAKAVFESMDANGDGELDAQELQCRLSDFGVEDQHIELLFYKLDTNHDGVIDLGEFVEGYDQYMSLVTTGEFKKPAAAPPESGGSLAPLTGGMAAANAVAKIKRKKKKKKKPKSVVSRLYQTPKKPAVDATASEGSLPEGQAAALAALGGGKGRLAALVNKNVLPTVEKDAVKKGGIAGVVKVAKKQGYKGADFCKDLHKKKYDIKEFREKRNKAVLRGMKYMKKFLMKDNCKALYVRPAPSSHPSPTPAPLKKALTCARSFLRRLATTRPQSSSRFGTPRPTQTFECAGRKPRGCCWTNW